MQMSKIKFLTVALILLLCQTNLVFSIDVTSLQLLFMVKQTFPECKEVSILITEKLLAKEKNRIARASVQNKIKSTIYVISTSSDIGSALSGISEGSIMVLYSSGVLSKNKSKLYILSKCKPKKIVIVTSSSDYSQSGALLGVLKDENQKLKVVLNLKHNAHLKSTFTPAFIQTVGIKEVIE